MYDLTGLMITALIFVGAVFGTITIICGVIAICKNIKRFKDIDKKIWRIEKW